MLKMNCQKSKNFSVAFVFVAILSSTTVFASYDNRVVEKTRVAVEKAGPCDWYTLAINAEKCFKKKVTLQEAATWLDQSLDIAQMPFNLELKGDYYNYKSNPDKAIEYYVRAMNTLKLKDGKSDISKLQKKVAKIIYLGG